MNYLLHLIVIFEVYLVLSLALDLPFGYGGRIVLFAAVPYGIGAYTWSLLLLHNWSVLAAMATAIVAAAFAMAATACLLCRCTGDEYALAAVGLQLVFTTILENWIGVTRGPYGVVGIPRPTVFGLDSSHPGLFCVIASILSWTAVVLLTIIKASPFARTLRAVRDDEVAAMSIGRKPSTYHAGALILFGAFAGFAGILSAAYVQYIDPTSFSLDESIFVAMILILGGAGRQMGPLLGSAVLVGVSEGVQFLPLAGGTAANVRQIAYGLVLIVLLRFRPQGLVGQRNLL